VTHRAATGAAPSTSATHRPLRVWTTVMGQRLDHADDTRSMLLCAELRRRGHHVTMWTSAYDHVRKTWRPEYLAARDGVAIQPDGLQVRFMRGIGYHRNISVRRLVDHWVASRDFQRAAAALERPDLIIASLPDHVSAAAAVAFANARDIPVVVDVRDKWPDLFVDRARTLGGQWLAGAVRVALTGERRRARRALRNASGIVAMMDAMLAWGLRMADRPPTWREAVFPLTPFARNFGGAVAAPTPSGAVADLFPRLEGRVVFSFIGTFNATQHPGLVLDAVQQLATEGAWDPLRHALVVAGDGADAEAVRTRTRAVAGAHFVGWVGPADMRALLQATDVGLLPMNFATPAFNNKAFAYLSSGLAVINGAQGELADLLSTWQAGRNVPPADVAAFAAAIKELATDAPTRDLMRAGAQRLFLAQFDREANYTRYVDHLERIVSA
jgi:glycosyltransferase involved in cell wall biosynthesis